MSDWGDPPDRKVVGNGNAHRISHQAVLLAHLTKVNRLRRPCPHCGLRISPEGMGRHVALCADRD